MKLETGEANVLHDKVDVNEFRVFRLASKVAQTCLDSPADKNTEFTKALKDTVEACNRLAKFF